MGPYPLEEVEKALGARAGASTPPGWPRAT